jgi:hypothetical protein
VGRFLEEASRDGGAVKITVAAVALLLALVGLARAEIDKSSGNHMLEPCRDVPLLGVVPLDRAVENDAFVCVGVAMGVWNVGSLWFCWRQPNATVGQVIQIAVKFMDEHPAQLKPRSHDTHYECAARCVAVPRKTVLNAAILEVLSFSYVSKSR